jgi:hypothetical protein
MGFIAKFIGAPAAVIYGVVICALVGLLVRSRIIPIPVEAAPPG